MSNVPDMQMHCLTPYSCDLYPCIKPSYTFQKRRMKSTYVKFIQQKKLNIQVRSKNISILTEKF